MGNTIKGKPESKIPKFILDQEIKPTKKRVGKKSIVRGPTRDQVAANVLAYCVTRNTLDLGLLTPKEKTTLLRLIKKTIPK